MIERGRCEYEGGRGRGEKRWSPVTQHGQEFPRSFLRPPSSELFRKLRPLVAAVWITAPTRPRHANENSCKDEEEFPLVENCAEEMWYCATTRSLTTTNPGPDLMMMMMLLLQASPTSPPTSQCTVLDFDSKPAEESLESGFNAPSRSRGMSLFPAAVC